MFFVNNYSVFVLSVTDMTFRGLHDADPLDPYVLVLHDRHRSCLEDVEQVCILFKSSILSRPYPRLGKERG